ncbi:unnamed protein product [Nyctereutes procyonoides]|uniref:(raccoon dog) hypothetical protein n=1 Tax=Nyctereutes procyonoides TaxID=34880 RepID=A0A811YMS5_NYCPR|nr:unnamed protein product [Nyctereutes procyonoides]
MLKFAAATGATPIAGHPTPRTFTNQIQKALEELRLLVVTDPRADHQPLQACLTLTCLPLLCVTETVLCNAQTSSSLAMRDALSGSDVWMLAWGGSVLLWGHFP